MLTLIGRLLGVIASTPGKTGKRETALLWFGYAAGLTAGTVWQGPDMVTAATALLMAIWGVVAALTAGAYGLEWSQAQGFMTAFKADPAKPANLPEGWPDIPSGLERTDWPPDGPQWVDMPDAKQKAVKP